MNYYRNTLNCYRLPAANANAMQLRAPDMRNSQNRNLCISAKIPLYRTYVALSTALPRGLWFCVSLQCGYAIKTELNASNTLGNRCSLHCSTPAVGGKNQNYHDSTKAQI